MVATPCWAASRPRLPTSSPTLPARCAPIAAALTGVHLFQPVLATRPVLSGSVVSAAAGVSATALARVPPNQAASPTSCRERDRVSCATGSPPRFVLVGTEPGYPPRTASHNPGGP